MKILVCNDDGIYAKGLRVLADALKEVSAVTIIAPDRNRSGASTSLTLDFPIRVRELEDGSISVEGTPTDCVHLGMTGLLNEIPDMVVSGVNEGSNLGDDVWYSGTVAAAIEGRFLGLPAIALSLATKDIPARYFETGAAVAKQLVQRLIKDPLPASTILNVNVPDVPIDQLRGFEITRLGTRHRAEAVVPTKDPRGNTVYWIGPAGEEQDAGPGTDFHAIANQKVSITPLRIDLTQYKAFDQLSQWINGMDKLA
jgi:5'-nucleotidase